MTPSHTPTPARVLLLNLNGYDQPYPVYPLGLAYLDGALREAGHLTRVWDGRMSAESAEQVIESFQPDIVGLSMRNIDNVQYHNPRSFVQEVVGHCTRIRAATTAPLVLGGSAFSIFPRELYELTGVDYGIQGEGERTLVRLIACLQTGVPPEHIAGLFHRDKAGAVKWLPAQPDDWAFTSDPHHDLELLRAYIKQGSLPGVQTQRGCPLHCCYCTYPLIEGRHSRYRSGAQVVEEMRRMQALGVRYTFMVDSVFNTRSDHVAQICEALIEAKLDMEWQCFLRPGNVSRELLQLMQRAGLRHVEFGSDSFSDAVLKSYGKSFTFDEIRHASESAHKLGLHYSHFLIFGGPGETPDTIAETLVRAQTLPGAYYFTTIGMRIYPETPLWHSLAPENSGETRADYLSQPRFHLAPGFTIEGLYQQLEEVQREHPNWIVGDPPQEFLTTVNKLRSRGLRGPLWEYIETLRRLQPPQAATGRGGEDNLSAGGCG